MIMTDVNGDDMFINVPSLNVPNIQKVERNPDDELSVITYIDGSTIEFSSDEAGHKQLVSSIQTYYNTLIQKNIIVHANNITTGSMEIPQEVINTQRNIRIEAEK